MSGPASLWHRRCCHFHPKRINASIPYTHGLQTVPVKCTCRVCLFSKQHASPIPSSIPVRSAAHEPLSQVSVDLADMSEPSFTGARYMCVFVDTFSRYTTVYAINKKSDAHKCLLRYMADVGRPREILSDWGSEFHGRFSAMCLQHQIRLRKSAPYSPFSNGIVERSNRTLKEAIRAMILEAGGSPTWWARAAVTAADTHNRLVNHYTPNKTPYELMWNVRPTLSHLRVFGSVCYPLVVPASRRKTLDSLKYPSSVGVYLGPCEHGPGVCVLDPTSKTVTVRRDVVVDEMWRFKDIESGRPTLHHVNPASTRAIPYPTDLQPISIATHIPKARVIQDIASRYVVDMCAGTSSALRYHLANDPKAQALAVDVLPYHKVVAHIPPEHRSRFHYRQIDVKQLTVPSLQKILYDTWSISIDCVDHWHASVPCQSYSLAHHGHNFHRQGLLPLTQAACDHYKDLESTIDILRDIASACPRTLISVENPVGMFQQMPCVQQCASEPNWKLLPEFHYCANTVDADGVFPKKPTTFLLHGVPDTFDLKQCLNDCPHRLSDTSALHKYVICRNWNTHPDQHVIEDVMNKGKIPFGVFDAIWWAHRDHIRPARPDNVQSDTSVTASSAKPPITSIDTASVPEVKGKRTKVRPPGRPALVQKKLSFAPTQSAHTASAHDPAMILPTPATPIRPTASPAATEDR